MTGGDAGEVLRVFQTKDETRAFYDKISPVYDVLAERSERPMRARGLDALAAASGDVVLEIGHGTGGTLVDLAAAVAPRGRVLGLDLSEGMTRRAAERLRQEDLGAPVHLVRGDAEHLPIDAGRLDGIFMSFTLELFDTPVIPSVLAECRRVLRAGGRLGVVCLSKDAPPGMALEVFQWTHEHFPNLLDCRPIYGRRMIEAAGFDIVSVGHARMWVPVEIVVAARGDVPDLG